MSCKSSKVGRVCPKVTIVLTAYNREQYITEQIESILDQTYSNWDLIITDDSSTDGTLKIAQKYAKKYHNINVISHEKNQGVAKNFESGLDISEGDYIGVCDVDDYWLPEKLETQVNYLVSHPHISLVYHDLYITDVDLKVTNLSLRKHLQGNSLSAYLTNVKDDTLISLLRANHITSTSIMFRSNLKKYLIPIPANILQDYWVVLVAAAFSKIGYVDTKLALYRQHSQNMQGVEGRDYKFYMFNLFNKNFGYIYIQETRVHINALEQLKKRIGNIYINQKLIQDKIDCLVCLIALLESHRKIGSSIEIALTATKKISKTRQKYHIIYLAYFLLYKLNPFKK